MPILNAEQVGEILAKPANERFDELCSESGAKMFDLCAYSRTLNPKENSDLVRQILRGASGDDPLTAEQAIIVLRLKGPKRFKAFDWLTLDPSYYLLPAEDQPDNVISRFIGGANYERVWGKPYSEERESEKFQLGRNQFHDIFTCFNCNAKNDPFGGDETFAQYKAELIEEVNKLSAEEMTFYLKSKISGGITALHAFGGYLARDLGDEKSAEIMGILFEKLDDAQVTEVLSAIDASRHGFLHELLDLHLHDEHVKMPKSFLKSVEKLDPDQLNQALQMKINSLRGNYADTTVSDLVFKMQSPAVIQYLVQHLAHDDFKQSLQVRYYVSQSNDKEYVTPMYPLVEHPASFIAALQPFSTEEICDLLVMGWDIIPYHDTNLFLLQGRAHGEMGEFLDLKNVTKDNLDLARARVAGKFVQSQPSRLFL